MGCCGSKPEPEGFSGIKDEDRKCTDILCCLIFVICIVACIGTGVYGWMYGNAARLLYGQDMEGNQCGSGNYASKVLTVYPKMNEDIISAAQEFGGDVTALASNIDKIKFSGVCVSECPKARKWICSPSGNTTALAMQAADATYAAGTQEAYLEYCYGLSGGGAYASVALQYTAPGCASALSGCWRTPLNTTNILFRCLELYETKTNQASECVDPPGATADKCLVKKKTTTTEVAEPGQPNYLMDMLNSWASVAMALVGDAMKSYVVILVVAIGGGLVLGFVWLFILRLFAGIIVWATIIVLLLLCGVGTFYAYMKAGLVDASIASTVSAAAATSGVSTAATTTASEVQMWSYIAYAASALSIIFLLVIVAVREKINIAVAILKEASKALADMPFMVLFPGVTTIGVTVFFVVWAYLFALVYTAGGNMDFSFLGVSTNGTSVNATNSSTSLNIGNATLTISFTASSFKDYMCIFDFFMLLWINNFIQGIGIMTICGAVVKWYWTKSPKGENMEGNPVLSAYMRTWYFHSGSVAFGAFLIAVVQFIRAVLAYIDSQTKELQESNFMMKVIMKCVQCLLWCFEKCMKFITKNAYIIVQMKGKSFCSAAYEAFGLIWSHLAQISTAAFVGNLMVTLGKVVIIAGNTILAYLWLTMDSQYLAGGANELSSIIMPVIFTIILSYMVASGFMEVYAMGIDAILLSYCVDVDENDGSANKPFFMGDELKAIVAPNATSAGDEDKSGGKAKAGETAPAGDDDDDDGDEI